MKVLIIFIREPCFEGAVKSTMSELAQWVVDSDRVITF